MKPSFCIHALSFLLLGIGLGTDSPAFAANQQAELIVSGSVLQSNVTRAGINLGGTSSWGAEQLLSNVILNPGFEGIVDGALATVRSSQGTSIAIGRNGTYRGAGFWNGGRLTVQTGRSTGTSISITAFNKDPISHEEIVVLQSAIRVDVGDVVSLSRVSDSGEPTHWWIRSNRSDCHAAPPCPGCGGRRSWALCSNGAQAAELDSFLDTITPRAGKLLPIEGKWRFSFWSMASEGQPRLNLSFTRVGSRPFFLRQLLPSRGWQKTIVEFDAQDNGPNGPLQLQFAVHDGALRIDDVELSKTSDAGFPFRHEVVATLKSLHPGYLRDWQGQLGDTADNRLAAPFDRLASRYRSDNDDDAKFEYSIPEFLELCKAVDADPWVVLPTVLDPESLERLGIYLRNAQRQFGFREILVEFGNEDWNPLFSTAGIQDPVRYGEASSRAFASLRKGFGPDPSLRTVVNAQFVNFDQVKRVTENTSANIVAVAPYFAFELPAAATIQQTDALLFSSQVAYFHRLTSLVASQKRELSFYEMNMHTVGGQAPPDERDRFVLSIAGGTALAQRMIDASLSGVRVQCVYTLAGYDATTSQGKGLVQLWGVARDLDHPNDLRATGFALQMFNEAVQSESHEVFSSDGSPAEGISAIAFHGEAGWSVAIASTRSSATSLSIHFPANSHGGLPRTIASLSAAGSQQEQGAFINSSAVTTNSTSINTIRVEIAPRDIVVLLPADTKGRLQ